MRGFTIVEIIVTITIMGILLTLAVVGVGSTQLSARDNERKADIEAIANNLESFHSSGSISTSTLPTVINVAPNPSLETDATGWGNYYSNASVTISRQTSGGYSGNAFQRMVWDSASAGADGGTHYGNFGSPTDYLPITATTEYTATGYARVNTNQSVYIGISWRDNSWNSAGADTTGPVIQLQPNTWTRLSITGTAPTGTSRGLIYIYAAPGIYWSTGSVFDTDAFMLAAGPRPYDYADGANSGWAWTGTSNASSSSGPAISQSVAGSYPGTAITISPLLTGYLADADTKSFTPPGQSDPYSSFVIATNNVQTTTGILPQPTKDQYVYQPIDSSGKLCINTRDCRKFNLYYRLEADNTVYMVTSKNQ